MVVAAAFVILFMAYGAQYSFGVFFNALLDEFGWSRASLSGAFSLYAFGYSVAGFPAGRLTDRWGPRAVIAVGRRCSSASPWPRWPACTALWQPYVLYGVVAALGMGTAYVPCSTTVVKWFVAPAWAGGGPGLERRQRGHASCSRRWRRSPSPASAGAAPTSSSGVAIFIVL